MDVSLSRAYKGSTLYVVMCVDMPPAGSWLDRLTRRVWVNEQATEGDVFRLVKAHRVNGVLLPAQFHKVGHI